MDASVRLLARNRPWADQGRHADASSKPARRYSSTEQLHYCVDARTSHAGMRAPRRRSSVTTPSTVSFGPSSRRPRPLGSSSSPSTPSPSASALFLPPRTSAHRPRTRSSSSRRLDSTDSLTRADCPTRTGLHAKGNTSRRGHLWRCDDVRGRQHGTAPVLEVRPPRPSLLRSSRADSPARRRAFLQVLRPRHRLALVLQRLGFVLRAAGGASRIRRLDLHRSSSHDSPVRLAPQHSTRTFS